MRGAGGWANNPPWREEQMPASKPVSESCERLRSPIDSSCKTPLTLKVHPATSRGSGVGSLLPEKIAYER